MDLKGEREETYGEAREIGSVSVGVELGAGEGVGVALAVADLVTEFVVGEFSPPRADKIDEVTDSKASSELVVLAVVAGVSVGVSVAEGREVMDVEMRINSSLVDVVESVIVVDRVEDGVEERVEDGVEDVRDESALLD